MPDTCLWSPTVPQPLQSFLEATSWGTCARFLPRSARVTPTPGSVLAGTLSGSSRRGYAPGLKLKHSCPLRGGPAQPPRRLPFLHTHRPSGQQ